MQKCRICGGSDFYKEAGYYFCQTCQTQNEDIREEVLELRVDTTTRLRRTRIRKARSDLTGEEAGWTTWELYNFVLIGMTNELIELGVSSDIKLTVLQLWATYLGKIEVAFISSNKKSLPKLARRYNKRDAQIIYGKVKAQKRARKRRRTASSAGSMTSSFQSDGSSTRDLNKNKRLLATVDYDRFIQSQASSEGDGLSLHSQSLYSIQSSNSGKSSGNEVRLQFSSHAREETRKIKKLSKNVPRGKRTKYKQTHVTTKYKTGPYVVTPMRLWAIIYLALRIHNEPLQLADMLRYGREGHLSYYKLDHLLPPEVTLTKSEVNFLSQQVALTHKGMRRIVASMAKFLNVWTLVCPDYLSLINRYCQELGLPRGIQLYAERLVALSPPQMKFDSKRPYIPNYEGRAIAFIIVVLKVLLGLDGVTEYHISDVAEKINSVATDRALVNAKLFSFREWQRYIECRKTILIHSHFPTKLKYSPNTPGIDGLYLKFLESINSKGDRDEPEITNRKNYLPEDLVQAMKKCMISFSDNDLPPKDMELFPPSLTPLHSYLHRLLNHPLHDLPTVVRTDFFLAKVGYMTRPDSLKELARQCDIDLKIIDTNLHFVEKMVPPFEQYRMPTVEELNAPVEVEDSNFETERCVEETTGSLNNYLHRKIPFKMRINNIKQYYYNTSKSVTKNYGGMKKSDDFSFNDILPDGRLAIPPHDDFKDDKKNEDTMPSIAQTSSLLNDEFCNKYNLCLSDVEKQSVRSPDKVNSIRARKETLLVRDAKGKFIKRTDARATVGMKKPVSETNSFLEFEDFMNDIDDLSILRMEDTDLLQLAAQIEENVDTNLSFSLNEYLGSSQISLFPEDNPLHTKKDEDTAKVQFFRPFRDYWMYHCIFSRVKPKNFEAFEKTLPRTFRWLLKECAYIVEMPTEDLYEEICLIEAYHANILRSSEKADNANVDSKAKRQCNIVLSKW